MSEKNQVSITETIANCTAAGITLAKGAKPVQSPLKQETSMIGMAYLNYIYQNDLQNLHFCESMLLMNSQVTDGTPNPYIHLFDPEMASKTMEILTDIQLAFDYSIARSNPSIEKIQASVETIQAALKK